MAASSHYHHHHHQRSLLKHTKALFSTDLSFSTSPQLFTTADEFDESDIWGSSPEPKEADEASYFGARKGIPFSRAKKAGGEMIGAVAASLPVNIPDWTRTVEAEDGGDEEDEEMVGGGMIVPPHEYLWRRRRRMSGGVESFSVHDGVGRTLKGRDLSRLRNAIWEKTGFQD